MLGADVDALGEDLSTVTLVHNDAESVWSDVVDASSLSVISLEWHALVNCTITLKYEMKDVSCISISALAEVAYLNINIVSDLVDTHVCGQWNCSMVSELTREHVARSAAVTVRSSHVG